MQIALFAGWWKVGVSFVVAGVYAARAFGFTYANVTRPTRVARRTHTKDRLAAQLTL